VSPLQSTLSGLLKDHHGGRLHQLRHADRQLSSYTTFLDSLLERRAQRRLAVLRHVEEISGNVAATCRYYGISRQCYYGWLRRYEADGLDGLKDRSRRPHHSPRATQAEVVEKIVWLRRHYHFGPAKIAMYRPATTTSPSASPGCGGF
jgi:transposase-like protein